MAGKTKSSPKVLQVDGLTLDLKSCQVTGDNGTHRLRPMECRLLKTFMTHPGKLLSYKFLMEKVWGTDFWEDYGTIQVHVCWLRKKIEKDPRRPRHIRTERGIGYRFG